MKRERNKSQLLRKLDKAEDIAKIYFEEAMPAAINDAKDTAAGEVMLLCMWVLHADFGFGKDRLMRWLDSIFEFSNTVIDENIKFDEVLDMLEKECKYNFSEEIYDLKGARAKRVKRRRDFLETYRFSRRITKADEQDV